jgi:hypothetical protein
MDVHKPKLIRNWREFLKEYAIIVIGVLTALLAEQAVQSIEWQHKVRAAIADMEQELSAGDGPESYARLAMHDCLATRLTNIRSAIEKGDRDASTGLIETVWLPNKTYDSFAHDSAIASDVGSHMPVDRMFNFRIVYSLIPELNRLQDKELSDLALLRALPATGGPIQQAEKLSEINAIEALRLDNDRMARAASFTLRQMQNVGVDLDRGSLRRNIRETSPHYRGCLTQDLRPLIATQPALNSNSSS